MERNLILGADLGWVSQLEAEGYTWMDHDGRPTDPIEAAKKLGANAVRLRVFVNPPKEGYWMKKDGTVCMLGFCDADSVRRMAERVMRSGMKLMLDFHYSDHFADPMYQDIPEAWSQADVTALAHHVYDHTSQVLSLLKEDGVSVEWVQVGNEINPGILLPYGSMKEHPDTLVHFLNEGYRAVKESYPQCQVITHLSAVQMKRYLIPFLDTFFARGGKTDILGFSYYPYWFSVESNQEELAECLREYAIRYGKPVMVVETGGEDREEEKTSGGIRDAVEAILAVPEQKGLGVFYWEPEVAREAVPDQYPLGAARIIGNKKLAYTNALKVYGAYRKRKE